MTQPSTNGLPGPASGTLDTALAEIERITRIADAPLRNLLITQAYCDLSHGMATVTGTGHANWSSFAAWASKTAGQTIRGEEVPREVALALQHDTRLDAELAGLEKRIPGLLWIKVDLDALDVARAVVHEVSDQIAAGNLKVFAELAPLFARFVHAFADPARRTPEALRAFLSSLAAGPTDKGGQDSLALAFSNYFAASVATTSKTRAELVLHANLLIGLHEQTRLQPNIQGGIDAPVSPNVYRRLAEGSVWALPVFRSLYERRVKLVLLAIRAPWERIVTRHLMRLVMPGGGSISLAEDIRVTGRPFPLDLDPLDHPPLVMMVRTYDRNPASLAGSGARNWTSLGDRMAFITDFFRSSQCDGALFDPPFTAAQVEAIRAGKLPTGPL